ncbi:hypothetical protein WR25_05016 [Diploscapter pachys]|uniref:Uncharacterized protein n=1 Tax=Diploscapter pachys TaxID=2018661 RepID=A0A2A2J546_9BILA|nr:hypothetical protein WR25_05016 [Diploscapter pachys]
MEEIEEQALRIVGNQLQRVDQLEKLGEMRKKADRKKAAVEAMLRTGVQSQLEGIRTAIAQLNSAPEDVKSVEGSLKTIRERLKPLFHLQDKMLEIRTENARHRQYAAAMSNLKLILNLKEIVAETKQALEENKLLVAHKHIMDLERARDELLLEMHKQGNSSGSDNSKIQGANSIFADVDPLVRKLHENIRYIAARALEMCSNSEEDGPTGVVSALRIVEREERIDRYYIQQNKDAKEKFMPPGRPRQWERIYLENARHLILRDLLSAHDAAVHCFPAKYDIFNRCVSEYHKAVQKEIQYLAGTDLDKAELSQLLKWIKLYGSDQLMGHRKLGLDPEAMLKDEPLLTAEAHRKLCDAFIEMSKSDIQFWLERALNLEKNDWYRTIEDDHSELEMDDKKCYYTTLPSTLFSMLRDNFAMGKEIDHTAVAKIVMITFEYFEDFVDKFNDAVRAFRNKHFENRAIIQKYTSIMISIVNNMVTCIESTDKYRQQIRLTLETNTQQERSMMDEVLERADSVREKFAGALSLSISCLRDEIYEDLKTSLEKVVTKDWLYETVRPIGTIDSTIEDYYYDYMHLKPQARAMLTSELQLLIVREYLKAIETRRYVLSSTEERVRFCNVFHKDVDVYARRFDVISKLPDMEDQVPDLFPLLYAIADVIGLKDKSILSLEATGFARKFPNIPVDLLIAVLTMRDDIGRNEAKSLAEEIIQHVKLHPKDHVKMYEPLFERLGRAETTGDWLPDLKQATNALTNLIRRGDGQR